MASQATGRNWLAPTALIAGVYALTGYVGIQLAIPPGNVTVFWPPSGIALAAVMLLGTRALPGIWLGALLINAVNLYAGGSASSVAALSGVSSLIGIGSFLQPMLGAYLVRRYRAGEMLESGASALKFGLIAFLMCLVSPTIGTAALLAGGYISGSRFAWTWYTWWLGDSLGVLVFAPLALLILRQSLRRSLVILAILLAGAGGAYFSSVSIRDAARRSWENRARQEADRNTSTFLFWLDLSYAPLNGMVELFNNSQSVTVDEFLDSVDSLEEKLGEIFPSAVAVLVPDEGPGPKTPDRPWRVHYSTDREGFLAKGFDFSRVPFGRAAVEAAFKNPNRINFGSVYTDESGKRHALISTTIRFGGKPAVLVGMIAFTDLIEGLFKLRVSEGMQLRLWARLANQDPEAPAQRLYGSLAAPSASLMTVQLKGASGKAQIEFNWDVLPAYKGGPPALLANVVLLGGTFGALILTVFIGFLYGQNEQITKTVAHRTEELKMASSTMQVALENMSDGIVFVDSEQRIVFFNRRYIELMDYPEDLVKRGAHVAGVLRHHASQLGFGEGVDQERRVQEILEGYRSGREEAYKTKLPSGRIVEVRRRPTVDGGAVAIVSDITDREAAREQLESRVSEMAEARRATLNMMSDADAAKKRAEEMRSRAEEASRELEKRVAELADARRATLNMMKDAEEARARAEELRDQAEAATRAKAVFLAAMSHEIRTPMNGVVGMIDILRETKLSADQMDMVTTVRDSAFSLLQIINDILDFSKIEAGKLALENIPVSIRDAVEGVAETLAANAQKKGVELITFIDPDIPDWVMGDQVRIRQILFNLGGNAVKFTGTEERAGKVVIRADRVASENGRERIRFTVTDNGIGIPKEAQERLFQAFTQAESSTTRRFGGTGLGLSICANLTELMGGEIGVESEVGAGSTFHVTLPFAAAEEKKDGVETKGRNLEDLKVLLVSRVSEYREFLARYMSHWGADVIAVGEPGRAPEVAEKEAASGRVVNIVVMAMDLSAEEQGDLRKGFDEDPRFKDLKFVVVMRGRRRSPRLDLPISVTIDASPLLRRASFLTAVAVAAGRASPEVKDEEEIERHSAERTMTIEEAESAGQLILVAEDNETNQKVIRRQLNMLGYAAEIANDGREALEAWKSGRYGVVLTDCHMPSMDGYELTAAIRGAEDTGERIPIIAITANALQGEGDRCLEAGMDDYLAKPLEMGQLKRVLAKWMPALDRRRPEGVLMSASSPGSEKGAPRGGEGDVQTPSEAPLDPSAIKDVFGDDPDTFKEILDEFVGPAEAIWGDIETAFGEQEAEAVGASAHKLKSSSRTVGAFELGDLCEKLEKAGKSGTWDEIRELTPLVGEKIRDVIAYIKKL